MKLGYKISLLTIVLLLSSSFVSSAEDLYSKQGENWEGLCKLGKNQSPVNIIERINTKHTLSTTSFNYKMPTISDVPPKFYYDGSRIYMEVDLGEMTHQNQEGANEIYRAYKIEIHVPAEHYVTEKGQTPRSAVEIQIHHKLLSSDYPEITNKVLLVKESIVSILLEIEGENPDLFLESTGFISKTLF